MTRRLTGLIITSATVPLILLGLPGLASAENDPYPAPSATSNVLGVNETGYVDEASPYCTFPSQYTDLAGLASYVWISVAGSGSQLQDVTGVYVYPEDSTVYTGKGSKVTNVTVSLYSNTYDANAGAHGTQVFKSDENGGANNQYTSVPVTRNHIQYVDATVTWDKAGTNGTNAVLDCLIAMPQS